MKNCKEKNLKKLDLKKILVRSTNWIGDVIMTTPAVRTIRNNFPEAEISLLARPWVADIFAASPHIDRVIVYDKNGRHRGFRGLLHLSNTLKKQYFDAAILLQNAFEAAFLAWKAGIPVRAGYKRDGRSTFLNYGIDLDKDIGNRHQVYYYQDLLTKLGLTAGSEKLFLRLSEDDRVRGQKYRSGLTSSPVIGLNPGAAYGPAKCWPAERYGSLASLIHEKSGAEFLVFGAPADKETGRKIAEQGEGYIHNLAGETTLSQAMALIANCDAFVTNDSGLMHVAAAAGTPLVAIFGSTDAAATGPFSDNASVIQKKMSCQPCFKRTCNCGFSCMLDINVEEVAEEVLKKLA
ncbi:MAG: lipopolysaccharide heptosyltransferase II [Desulfobia sp.]